MRIIAGLAKGKILSTPKGRKTRFTSDLLRGSLFNILGQDLTGKSFLDLFAGVGSVGIEALSRGAEPVVFVENDRQNLNYIRANLKHCGLAGKAQILPLSFKQSLRKLSSLNSSMGVSPDYIFLDPPYSVYNIENILQDLIAHAIIPQFCVTIVEHSKKDVVPRRLENLNLSRDKVYGQTVLSFYKKTRIYTDK